MSECSDLLDCASVALDEAVKQLVEVQHQLRLAKLGIYRLRERLIDKDDPLRELWDNDKDSEYEKI